MSYINEIEDDWNKVKSIITYIVATTILTIITTTIIAISSRSRIQKTERRINLIEGFLPTNKTVNLTIKDEVEAGDKIDKIIIDRIKYGK